MGNVTEERTSQSELEQVKERVGNAAEQVKGQTREELRAQIDTRTTQAGEQVTSTARAVRRAGQQLREEGNDRAAEAIDAVADRGERLGAYLTGARGDAMLYDVESFARRQPWLVAGAGAVAGFLAARFVKASSVTRYRAAGSRDYGSTGAVPTVGGSSDVH
jgi:ElaB/YqjD/DUF883 family membrane-anchored ribosome-binding protein